MRGIRIPAAAVLLLRFALPVCVIAASCVAAFGLFRDVSKTTTARAESQSAPSLSLGAGARSSAPLITPPATPPPSLTPSTAPPAPVASLTVPVEVLNASGVSGLAGRAAQALRLRGVNVASIGNLPAPPAPVTGAAVYYPPGSLDQAQALARLSGAATVAPAPVGLGAAGTLVLVLTDAKSAVAAALTSYVP